MMELLWLLLPVAAASGWWAAQRAELKRRRAAVRRADYFQGLNYLIDDQSDQAVQIFTRMADVDQDTADIHLALGNLCRRRGEVDRAIHIHGSLIARTALPADKRRQAMLELGEDYRRAGLLDRAELLFRELLDQPTYTQAALSRLISIFQQEKDWRQAIAYSDRLERISNEYQGRQIAHFCCELAEAACTRQEDAEAKVWLQDALARDAGCTRANLLLGQLAMRAGDYPAAIAAFQAVERQDQGYFPEVIAPLSQCYGALGQLDQWIAHLRAVQQQDHGGRITEALADWLLRQEGAASALHFLETELCAYPTLPGLRRLVEIKLALGEGVACTDLRVLYDITTQWLNSVIHYRCNHCGFATRSMLWCCPSCRQWSTIKPVPDGAVKS